MKVKLRDWAVFFGLDTLRGWLVFLPLMSTLIGSLSFNWWQKQEIERVEISCGNCVPVSGGELCLRTADADSPDGAGKDDRTDRPASRRPLVP